MISVLNRKYPRAALLAWMALLFLAGCYIHGVELRLKATSAVTAGDGRSFSEAQIRSAIKVAQEVATKFRMPALEPSILLDLRRKDLPSPDFILVAGYEKPRTSGYVGYTKRGDWARVMLSVLVSRDKSELLISVADRDSPELTPFVREIQEAISRKVKETFPGYAMEWKEG